MKRLKAIGFVYVALDLSGFESGSLNQLIQITVEVHPNRDEETLKNDLGHWRSPECWAIVLSAS